jgi:hypothetical protein
MAVWGLNCPFTILVQSWRGAHERTEISTMAETWNTHADIGTAAAIDDAYGSDRP